MAWFKTSLHASQVSNKVGISSSSDSTAEWADGRGLCLYHGLFPPGLWHLSEAFPRRPLGSRSAQAFPSLQVWFGRNTKPFPFRGVWCLVYCFVLVVSEHFIEISYFILLTATTESETPSILEGCSSFHKCALSWKRFGRIFWQYVFCYFLSSSAVSLLYWL